LELLPDLDYRLINSAVVHKLREEQPDYWLKKADELEASAPRPGQYLGGPVDWETGESLNPARREELSERWYECIATATACRRHAALLEDLAGDPAALLALLSGQEIAA
jgi:hypothetical protein